MLIAQNIVEEFPDVMVDIETTGTDQQFNYMIQIAMVRFNLAKRTIYMGEFFDRCLLPAPNRYWQESRRTNFWAKRQEVFKSIQARMEDPATVLKAAAEFAGEGSRFWGKPTHFDHSFLDSYFKQYDMQIPFHYREATDMNSFIRGRYFPEFPPNWEKDLPFQGEAHNGLHDCFHQIKVLFKVMEDTENAQN